MILLRIAFCACVVLCVGCGGLDPTLVPTFTGVSGTITYVGGSAAWPPADSVYEVRVVAFDEAPTDASQILGALLSGKALVSDTMPRRVDASTYTIAVTSVPRTFGYVVVALRYGPDFQLNWRMLDVYSLSGDPTQPSALTVNVNEDKRVHFRIDFSNLPPQPF
ncbi:MAG: hypothetical protein SGJ05_08690 [bacterium]|nr:hypothetical protein [bacterium]